jgi:hypothetical protein
MKAHPLRVMNKRCNECLFSKRRIVSASRKADVLAECERKDRHFECHKATINGAHAGCRGFYDERPSTAQQVLGRLGLIEFIDVPTEPKQPKGKRP